MLLPAIGAQLTLMRRRVRTRPPFAAQAEVVLRRDQDILLILSLDSICRTMTIRWVESPSRTRTRLLIGAARETEVDAAARSVFRAS
jgi:hypothetical protein